MPTIGETIRKQETEYRRGLVRKSKYVTFNMHDTIEKIDAYLNSTHITGKTDSLGREKPFFNIVTAMVNIWMRATDIDRRNIKFRADGSKDWLNAIIAKIFVRQWMRKQKFGQFLNEWGRVLARYGSAVIKVVENDTGLHINVTSWQRHICDAVEYDPNPHIDVLELTRGELHRRVTTMGYDAEVVKQLLDATSERDTLDFFKKDNKPDYIKLYEIHLLGSRGQLLRAQGKPHDASDESIFVQQMHVVSFVGKKGTSGRTSTKDFDDYTVLCGEEDVDPFMLTHLIKESDRTLAIGPVENAFPSQWMVNHSAKSIKDALDIASMHVFQTADPNFAGQNVIDSMQSGDILLHALNLPITKVDMSKTDIGVVSNFAVSWKSLSQEINGISEAMLGIMPAAGTPAAQTQAILNENYSLFQLMTENKGLHVEDLMRDRVLPFVKKTALAHSDEIGAELEDEDIQKIDAVFLKAEAIKRTNSSVLASINHNLDRITAGQSVQPIDVGGMLAAHTSDVQNSLGMMGNTRYFTPSEITHDMWSDQLADFGWDLEVDVTGEENSMREMADALNQALALVMQPDYIQNPDAQMIVRKIFANAGAVSPLQLGARPATAAPTPPTPAQGAGTSVPLPSPAPVPTG